MADHPLLAFFSSVRHGSGSGVEAGEVLAAGNRDGAEGGEMIGDPLDVEQFGTGVVQPVDEGDQRGLRRVGRGVEHRLAGEEPIDAQPVEPADQLVVEEHLHRVAPPEPEQLV